MCNRSMLLHTLTPILTLCVATATSFHACKSRNIFEDDRSSLRSGTGNIPASDNKNGLNVNDISVLFPLPDKNASAAEIEALLSVNELASDGNPILGSAIFEEIKAVLQTKKTSKTSGLELAPGFPQKVTDLAGPGIDYGSEDPVSFPEGRGIDRALIEDAAQWRIVAFRFDPCGPFLEADTSGCEIQFRLVAQPIVKGLALPPEPGAGTRMILAPDIAMHLIYTLDGLLLKEIASELQRLRQPDTLDAPLQVHPVLVRQGLNGSFAQGIKALIKKHASTKTLSAVAFMGTESNVQPWVFSGGLVIGEHYKLLAQRFGIETTSSQTFTNTTSEGTFSKPKPTDGRADVLNGLSTAFDDSSISVLAKLDHPSFARLNILDQLDPKRELPQKQLDLKFVFG